MVQIDEVIDEPMEEETPIVEEATAPRAASQERLLDAAEIEKAAAALTRPSAKVHLEALAKKLRKESAALKRVEVSQANAQQHSSNIPAETEQPAAAAPAPAAMPIPPTVMPTANYSPIDRFSFDAGGYNSACVTLYVPLVGVGSISRENISCNFTATSFDLVVKDLNGKSYRLFKDSLEKDIDPEKSKYIVKADKIVLKLAKIKSEYGSYDFWTELTAKNKKTKTEKENPAASIMDMMKDMYDKGDDNMKKVIGEAMLKQRRGELDDPMKTGGFGEDFWFCRKLDWSELLP